MPTHDSGQSRPQRQHEDHTEEAVEAEQRRRRTAREADRGRRRDPRRDRRRSRVECGGLRSRFRAKRRGVELILNGDGPTKFCPDCRQERPVTSYTRTSAPATVWPSTAVTALALAFSEPPQRLGPPRTCAGQGPRDVPDDHKWCPECDEIKPIDDFPRTAVSAPDAQAVPQPIVRANKEKHGRRAELPRWRRPNTSITITAPTGSAACSASTATARSASSAIARDLMLRAVLYLGRNVGESLDYPTCTSASTSATTTTSGPDDEPRVA